MVFWRGIGAVMLGSFVAIGALAQQKEGREPDPGFRTIPVLARQGIKLTSHNHCLDWFNQKSEKIGQ